MNAIVILDKPRGLTSHQAAFKVKTLLDSKRAGHTGTLDPIATGILPICLDGATKIIPFLDEGFKEYEAVVRLGITTDTMDSTGDIVYRSRVFELKIDDTLEVLSHLKKQTVQKPPMYSAVRIKGVRLYELARHGIEVDRPLRKIKIESLKLLDFCPPYIKFFVRCSRGTYVRVLATEIGAKLGCGGHLTELRRVKSGIFRIEDSVTLEDIRCGNANFYPIDKALSHYNKITVSDDISQKIRLGQYLRKSNLNLAELPKFQSGERLIIYENQRVVSISEAIVSHSDLNRLDEDQEVIRHLRVLQ